MNIRITNELKGVRAMINLRMSVTTSAENSGLLSVLLPKFEKANDVHVELKPVGTGRALKLAEDGEVDVVLVHSREAEEKFVKEGHGLDRHEVMYNDFVIVGPADDPADVKKAQNASDALRRITEAKAAFISRGDDSGTHKRERELWKNAGISPSGSWYVEADTGMGALLAMASEKRAYALSDRGTFYAHEHDLVTLFEGDPALRNEYGVIAVNPEKHPGVNYDLAKKLIDYMISPEGQRMVADFKVHGKPVFTPSALH
jgi:tungstate transport system substrate-binding protein